MYQLLDCAGFVLLRARDATPIPDALPLADISCQDTLVVTPLPGTWAAPLTRPARARSAAVHPPPRPCHAPFSSAGADFTAGTVMKLGAGKLCRVHAHDCLYSIVLRDIRAPEAAPNTSSSSPLSLPLRGEEPVASTTTTHHSALKRARTSAEGASAAPADAELPGSEPTKRAKLSTTATSPSPANGATKPGTAASQPARPAINDGAPAPAASPSNEHAAQGPLNPKLSWSPGLVNTQLVPRMPYPEDYFDACVPMNVFAAQVAAACDDLNETNLSGLLGAIGLPSEILVAAAQAVDAAAGRSPPRPAVDIMAACARIAFRMDADGEDEDEDEAGEAAMLADLESLVEHASGGDIAVASERHAEDDSVTGAAQQSAAEEAGQPSADSAAPAAANAPGTATPDYPMPAELQLDAAQMAELAALPERLRDQRLIALLYMLGGVDILDDEEAGSSDEDRVQSGQAAGLDSGALSSSGQPDTIQVVVSAAGDVSVPASPPGSSQEDAQLEGMA